MTEVKKAKWTGQSINRLAPEENVFVKTDKKQHAIALIHNIKDGRIA